MRTLFYCISHIFKKTRDDGPSLASAVCLATSLHSSFVFGQLHQDSDSFMYNDKPFEVEYNHLRNFVIFIRYVSQAQKRSNVPRREPLQSATASHVTVSGRLLQMPQKGSRCQELQFKVKLETSPDGSACRAAGADMRLLGRD